MLVLASQSPRRRQLLANAGIECVARPSGIEEAPEPGESPESYVSRLALDKARAVEAAPEEYILAADTIVVIDGRILEKPASVADAARMIGILSGQVHSVMTGVCLRHAGHEWSAVEITQVSFLPLTQAEIDAYAASGEPMDKAGAYAIQGLASKFIDRIEGCYFNVVGLPVARVYRMLRAIGYPFQDKS
jgi:septum formation protein